MTTIKMHPSELAFTFTYSNTEEVIGWGGAPFLPANGSKEDPGDWYTGGLERLKTSGLVTETDDGINFTDELTSVVLALADPALVLLVQRKEGDGQRKLTIHVAKDAVWGMSHNADGLFEVTRYADFTAATAACVGFLGAARSPAQADTRITSDQETLGEVHKLATTGKTDQAQSNLVKIGASEADAASIIKAMADPAAAGMLSILYCSDNIAQSARPISVMTNADDETWILFPPASLEGPMIIERSSISALTARVVVDVAAWAQVTSQRESA